MRSFENRLGKLEGAMTPIQVVGPVIYTFWAPSDSGPKKTGARAIFPGFEGLNLEPHDGEDLEGFGNRAEQVFEELLALKSLSYEQNESQ